MQVTPIPTTSLRAPDSAREFGAWVDPHWPLMAALARRLSRPTDWEDVLQDALSSAWRKRSQFDASRGTARSWLLAIVADQARKSFRGRRPILVAELAETAVIDSDRALGLDLDRAIVGLTERQRLAVTLHYFLGLSMTEIAAVMTCSEGTVKSTLSDARKRIRTHLGEDYR